MMMRENDTGGNSTFLIPEEVAKILRVNVLTVYGYIRNENLSAVRLGRNYRIARQDFDAFVESKRTGKVKESRKKPCQSLEKGTP
jgi:excisionase family DNA binding protein